MSVHSFIAHFLKENGYKETLRTFEAEHGNIILPELPHEETLETIIADRLRYLSIDQKNGPDYDEVLSDDLQAVKSTQLKPWLAPYPKTPLELGPVSELIVDCAILTQKTGEYALLATSAKSLVVADLRTKKVVLKIQAVIGNVVVRRIVVAGDLVLLCGMNGKVTSGRLSENLCGFDALSETQIHPRLVTDIKVVTWHGETYVVSMGWDFHVKVHVVDKSDGFKLKPVGTPYKLANQGSCLDAVVYENKLYVLVCKREITLMDVLCLNEKEAFYLDCRLALNDAEFSASGFSPMCVKIFQENEVACPLVAVGTSHEPHMRVIVVLLREVGQKDDLFILRNQILCNLNTYSPQDKYSDAQIQWRYDGSGVWIIGDDGVIRGLDVFDKSVDVKLHGHDGRIKCGAFYGDKVLSCGTDRKVIEWS
ncbi:hypothetical protein METBIDRAFT_30409 [Metschnikowia bicuspidata var. bicuspidata NRRL YB-4993]|uniref:LisH domain-containing protein n=1 Tax=Metschnikowia bicuspidata var. bicuspidata NRRL YB-4993 TaxID=869754 RepID=A0A1A0HJS2_9ASCO|nr:hypothetical protein METBIDRAFT_30409 [Metschnikowia bicuspidata var. bicuspidata NRRL YB-4993]OBA24063.1 hypothetical protein METBIDRAFT_30409 [Metschnikowia bicuspidata var. bicuspidata NRRL YB-4993]